MEWIEKTNLAQYGGADWKNKIAHESGLTLKQAKAFAAQDSRITFFFFVRQHMVLEGRGAFHPGDAVFFSGDHWLGEAPQADTYVKAPREEKEDSVIQITKNDVFVDDGKALIIGDLAMTFVASFELAWNDRDSGANKDGSFWKPIVPDGYHALGYFAHSGYDDPSEKRAIVAVKAIAADALKPPLDYKKVWTSQPKKDGAFWEPQPPKGYVAMGLVVTSDDNKPSLDEIMCVRRDLATRGVLGESIWKDAGSKLPQDFSAWEINTRQKGRNNCLAVGTFVGVQSHAPPRRHNLLYCLKMKLQPSEIIEEEEKPPQLKDVKEPEFHTQPHFVISIPAPYLVFQDDEYEEAWQIKDSPFYTLERQIFYQRVFHRYNQTSKDVNTTHKERVGISRQQEQSFFQTTGIALSEESAAQSGGRQKKVSKDLSKELGFSRSGSITRMRETEISESLTVAPHKAIAVWVKANKFTLKRADDAIVKEWEVTTPSLVIAEYPQQS